MNTPKDQRQCQPLCYRSATWFKCTNQDSTRIGVLNINACAVEIVPLPRWFRHSVCFFYRCLLFPCFPNVWWQDEVYSSCNCVPYCIRVLPCRWGKGGCKRCHRTDERQLRANHHWQQIYSCGILWVSFVITFRLSPLQYLQKLMSILTCR